MLCKKYNSKLNLRSTFFFTSFQEIRKKNKNKELSNIDLSEKVKIRK